MEQKSKILQKMLSYKLRTCCEGRSSIWKLSHWLLVPAMILDILDKSCLLAIAATTSLLLLFFSNMYANGKTQSMLFHSSLKPLYFIVCDLSQASCKSWLSGIFCLVYYLSLDCGIEFPCTAGAAESQGRAWLAFEMKQTEHGRLFIRSKHVIVEKVWAATTCWCVQGEVEAMSWWCHQVRTVSKRAVATRFARRVTDEESNQYQKRTNTFWWGSEANKQTVKTTAAQNIVRRAANTQIQHRTHNNNNNHSRQTIQ